MSDDEYGVEKVKQDVDEYGVEVVVQKKTKK